MSSFNIHPPQTYSRLFRPWDKEANKSGHYEKPVNMVLKNERCSPETAAIKAERGAYNSNDSDQDCACSNSSKFSYDDGLSHNDSLLNQTQMDVVASPSRHSPHAVTTAYTDSTVYDEHLHHHIQMMAGMAPASDLYYNAATANAIIVPPSASSFGMDPYTLGLMEQEYARVMAEDAQLKAMNARKQRPKKFKCPHCDVAFSNNGQLKGHIRIHTGERPFKCDVESCGKTFTRNEELTRHKRIHTGLRPYPCTACGKKFGRRDHLKKHMKTHIPQERQLGPPIFVSMYPYIYGY